MMAYYINFHLDNNNYVIKSIILRLLGRRAVEGSDDV